MNALRLNFSQLAAAFTRGRTVRVSPREMLPFSVENWAQKPRDFATQAERVEYCPQGQNIACGARPVIVFIF